MESINTLEKVQKRIDLKFSYYMKEIEKSEVRRHYIKSEIIELDTYYQFLNVSELINRLLKFDTQIYESKQK